MGYTTDFVGQVTVEPPLNAAEVEYLSAFASSRRWDRPDGPYAVPDNPWAERVPDDARDAYNRLPVGQPQLHCQWVPCLDGHCLSFDGREKFYRPVEWMRYLIDHFLAPGAQAATSGLPCFDGFTFDHICNGVIAGSRRDNGELFLIEVRDNVVESNVLVPALHDDWWGPLPYMDAVDEPQLRREVRKRVYQGS